MPARKSSLKLKLESEVKLYSLGRVPKLPPELTPLVELLFVDMKLVLGDTAPFNWFSTPRLSGPCIDLVSHQNLRLYISEFIIIV